MNDYLILKLQGPMQSWGGHTYEDYRPSEGFPTRSGVVGLLGACLGIDREEKQRLLELAANISMAVRADELSVGITRMTDFHTIQDARKVDGKPNKNPVISRREYLCDASFTIAVQVKAGSEFTTDDISEAVQLPVYTLFLGRRSCPVSRPLYEKRVKATTFTQALMRIAPGRGLIYSDVDEDSDGQIELRDVPLGRHRQFTTRRVYIHTKKGEARVSK